MEQAAATNKLLVFGDDGSISADLAWLWINCHEWPNWRLEVVTAERSEKFRVGDENARLRPWEPAHPRVPFTESQISDVTSLHGAIDPRLAMSRAADLLVIGRRGRGLAKFLHLGSTAEWLMAHPPAPMLIARRGRRTRSIVVCADGSAHATVAAATLAGMAWLRDVSVTVVTVDDGAIDVDQAYSQVAELFAATDATVVRRDTEGSPTHELLAVIEELEPDLVALGTRGLTGTKRVRVGSTASAIAHSVECSILLACDDPTGDATGSPTEAPTTAT
jgi:nucleotide-binding universal stress UspA family protein